MTTAIDVNEQIRIDPQELKVQFVRSPGPGGQNVNKVNSKAIVHWELGRNAHIPAAAYDRIRRQAANRINQDGFLVVSSHQSRDQAENLAFCHAKIRQIVLQSLVEPKARRPTQVTRAAKRRRLQDKRQQSEKKAGRKRGDWMRE